MVKCEKEEVDRLNKTNELGTKDVSKLLLQYSIPAIIGMIVNALYNIVDRMFIGNIPDIGPLAISGVGISMPIITIIFAFAMLSGIGTTANISLLLGRGDKKKAQHALGNGIVLGILTSIVLMVIMFLFLDKILYVFGASDATLVYAKEYTSVLIGGIIFTTLSFSLGATVRADGNPKFSALVMIVGCVINIILDYLFIFVFHLGIKGAAYATVISQAVSMFMVLYYYLYGPSTLKFSRATFKLDRKVILGIIAIGMSPFAMQIASSVVQVIANNILREHGGDLAIGAMTVITSVQMVFLMPIFGINQGSQPIIGFNYGAQQYNRVKQAIKLCTISATIILTIGWAIIQFFPHGIVGLFSNDPALTEMSVHGLRIFMLFMPIIGVPIIFSNYFQSVGKAKIAMLLSLLRQVIFLIPVILILPNFFGLTGVWIAGPIADSLSTIVTIYFFYRERNALTETIKMAA